MGGSIAVDSSVGLGSIFSFQVLFGLASASQDSVEHMITIRSPTMITIGSPSVPAVRTSSGTASARRSSSEKNSSLATTSVPIEAFTGKSRPPRATVLRFLVVDDNQLNKSMFERTVNNMFEKADRAKPVYTFAANGLYPFSLAAHFLL
jgi:hypothetical protein